MKSNFAGEDTKVLFIRYAENVSGLVIFTFGTSEILFGRKGSKVCQFNPYKVEVKSTLSAGDTFRAGVVYGLLNDWDDEKTVAFAAATAASVCTRFPMVFDPPSLEEVFQLMEK